MTSSDFRGTRRVGLCTSSYPARLGLQKMFTDSLHQIGFEVIPCEDGDRRALTTDILLLIGCSNWFSGYEKLLSEYRQERPDVFLWQFEPFPMPGLSEKSLGIGKKIWKCDFEQLPLFWNRLTKRLVLNRHILRDLYRKFLCRRFRKSLSPVQQQAYSDVSSRDIFKTMREGIEAMHRCGSGWCDYIIASTPPRVEFLREKKIDSFYAPSGWHPEWGPPLDRPRDIDVLFIGGLNGPRKRQFQGVRDQLSEKGIDIFVAQGYYGRERTDLLNRSKIVLDIDRLGWELPIMRLVAAMPCGALVITNWMGDPTPFSNDHLIQRRLEDFPEAVAYYLEHERQRQMIAGRAQDFVMGELSLVNVLRRLLVERKSWDGVLLKNVRDGMLST